ncbi:unnamed protein product [Polarella glacialis]|uniref:Uncharacterized protein n=1 Tax=Polarella glacialis TaxID=89957 RepID=A0A813HB92_POLGL|nr:unnamed protein product [Polarella glacialis]
MPSILDALVRDFGQGLDEKAHQALVTDVDSVSALSILHKLGENGQVRNSSAFVCRAVRNAERTGGSAEVEHALWQLHQAGIIDNQSLEMLQAAPIQAAHEAVAGLLMQEDGSIRNTSVCQSEPEKHRESTRESRQLCSSRRARWRQWSPRWLPKWP